MSHGKCHLCDATCRQCTGPESDDCLSCPATRFFDDGACVIRCQRGRYAMEQQCHPCHHTCQECDDGGPDNCTSCDKDKFGTSRYLYGGECRDVCPGGFHASWRKRCEACPANCAFCSSNQHCLHCSPAHYLKDDACVPLECGEGEVESPEHEDCLPCEEGCKKCLQKSPRECIACAAGYYQLGPDCYQNCPDRTYSVDASMQCVRCDDRRCLNCDQTQCYWCQEGHYVSDGECVEHCQEGFFVDEESQDCEPCHRACRACGGPNYDDCDACEDGYALTYGECVDKRFSEPCPDRRFRNGQGDCEQCHPSCLGCSGSGKEECNTCDPGRFLTARQACVSKCPSGAFGNVTSGRCEDCLPGCELCQDAGRCQRCSTGHAHLYLQDGQCVAECQRGFPRGGECQPCAPGCASCLGNATHCQSCSSSYLLLDHACRGRCPDRHYPRDGVCLRCPSDCLRCSQDGLCQECEPYYFLHKDACVGDCPPGFFPSPEQMGCVRCHADCASCDGPDSSDCDACRNAAAVRYSGECLSRCPGNTYYNTQASECRDCDRSCLSCSGPEPSSCRTCGADMRLDGTGHCVFYSRCPLTSYMARDGSCQPCHQHCHRCSGPARDDCLSCNTHMLLLNRTCVAECPMGYYGDGDERVCERCHFSCASCHGRHSIECSACKPGLFKLGRSCVETCGDSLYGNTTAMACERCDPSCGQCQGRGSGQCLTCRDGYLYHGQTGRCLQTCPPNFYPDTRAKACHRCHPTCKTCTDGGALACDTCYHGYRRFAGICESDCPVGQYTPSGGSAAPPGSGSKGFGLHGSEPVCVPCDRSCLDCWGPGRWNCTVCPALQILSDDRRCLSCCGDTPHDRPLPHACCDCKASYEECVLGVNFVFGGPEELEEQQGGRPALFVLSSIVLLLSLGAAVFLLLRTRYCAGAARKTAGSTAYEKLDSKGGGASSANPAYSSSSSSSASAYGEYSDRIVGEEEEEEEEEDDDIVYMGQDGTVYRKFKYGLLEQDEELEMEYDDESYSFT